MTYTPNETTERPEPVTKEDLKHAIFDKVARAEDLMGDFPPHRAMERYNEASTTLNSLIDRLFEDRAALPPTSAEPVDGLDDESLLTFFGGRDFYPENLQSPTRFYDAVRELVSGLDPAGGLLPTVRRARNLLDSNEPAAARNCLQCALDDFAAPAAPVADTGAVEHRYPINEIAALAKTAADFEQIKRDFITRRSMKDAVMVPREAVESLLPWNRPKFPAPTADSAADARLADNEQAARHFLGDELYDVTQELSKPTAGGHP